jgi:hypothetical protein
MEPNDPLCDQRGCPDSFWSVYFVVLQAVLVPKDINMQPTPAGSSKRSAAS